MDSDVLLTIYQELYSQAKAIAWSTKDLFCLKNRWQQSPEQQNW